MYFEMFPLIPYDSLGDGNPKDLTNLLRRVKVRSKIIKLKQDINKPDFGRS